MRRFIIKQRNKIGCLGGLILLAGILGTGYLVFVWWMSNFIESPSFWPLVWSPDNEQLAFGEYIEYRDSGIFVVDADGQHVNEVLNTFYETSNAYGVDGFTYIGWMDEDTLYVYSGPGMMDSYAVAVETGELWPTQYIPLAQLLQHPQPETYPPTACDNADYIGRRSMSGTGLLAQSSCTGYCDSCNNNHCDQDLQVCDTVTGELVFELKYPCYGRSGCLFFASITPMILSALVGLVGLIMAVVALLAPVLFSAKSDTEE